MQPFQTADSSEVKNESSIGKNTDISQADGTQRNDSNPQTPTLQRAKDQYSDVLNNLLLQWKQKKLKLFYGYFCCE